ncbi:MAG: hypothetical protein ABL897_06575 [Hyphomicrobium sp.]
MFEVFNRSAHRQRIDLASVRDTLLYIESDLNDAPHLERLADAVRSALAEIDRMELSSTPFEMPQISQARFLPAQL